MDAAVFRILDANFNRAREALRVMEEYARFGLDDATITSELKEARHKLAEIFKAAGVTQAIKLRNTPGDVGTIITTDAEYNRASMREVVIAAGKRLSEALRVIEEYGKTVSATLAEEIERIRYRGYDIEKRLLHALNAVDRFGAVRLYVLITESLCTRPWLETAEAAIEGGAACLQLREKTLSDGELLERAGQLRELCHKHGAVCIINDRADIAIAAGADGVHVGQDDMSVSAARSVVGPDKIVGVSTHTLEQARIAITQCPDYVAVGPMYDTPTKPQDHIAGPQTVTDVRNVASLPLVAIGGIDGSNLAPVVQAGSQCVCVCSAIISSNDPLAATRRIRESIDAALDAGPK